MKSICDFKEARAVSAYVVISPDGKHVGTVRAVFKDSGNCYVEVIDFTNSENNIYCGKAGGYGYDKLTAAMGGAIIDGHTISDHCAKRLETPTCGYFDADFIPPKGYQLANGMWLDEEYVYRNCYKVSGLDYLRKLGYQVIQAI